MILVRMKRLLDLRLSTRPFDDSQQKMKVAKDSVYRNVETSLFHVDFFTNLESETSSQNVPHATSIYIYDTVTGSNDRNSERAGSQKGS